MKIFNKLVIGLMMIGSITLQAQDMAGYAPYGKSFTATDVKTGELYEHLTASDTTVTQLSGTIKEVCKAKGCWMKVDLANGNEVFVKFKDYGFFVPTDTGVSHVIMNGLAFVEEMSVDEQRHYADDEGASKEEVEKITSPKKTLRFEADGVLIKR